MAYTYKAGYKTNSLASGNQTLYTTPADTVTNLRAIACHNTTAANITLMAYIVPSGGTVGTTNKLLNVIIPPNKTYQAPELINQTLEAGDALVFNATGLNVVVSVVEVV